MLTFRICLYFFIVLSVAFSKNETKTNNIPNGDLIIMEDQKSINILKRNIIPLIQKRINYDAVKKSMDNFSLVRKKTHFFIPGHHINSVTPHNEVINREGGKDRTLLNGNIKNLEYKASTSDKINGVYNQLANNKFKTEKNYTMDYIHQHFVKNGRNFEKNDDLRNNLIKKDENFDKVDNLHHNLIKKNDNFNKVDNLHHNIINKEANFDKINGVPQHSINNENTNNFINDAKDTDAKIDNINDKLVDKDKLNSPHTDYYDEIQKIYEQFRHNDFNDYFTYEQELELLQVLRKQENILKTITKDKKKKKKKPPKERRLESKEFENILKDLAEQKLIAQSMTNYTEFTFETPTTTTTTTTTSTTLKPTTLKPSTVLTVLNEIDVRAALKNDPYVRRILKMANKKRQKYVKNALLTIYN